MLDKDSWSARLSGIGWNAGFLLAAVGVAVAGTLVDAQTAPGGSSCSLLCSRHSSGWYLPLLAFSALLAAFGIVMGIVDMFSGKWTQAAVTIVNGFIWIAVVGVLAFLRA